LFGSATAKRIKLPMAKEATAIIVG